MRCSSMDRGPTFVVLSLTKHEIHQHVHVFEAVGPIEGEPQETEEMRPQWYAEQDIPYDKMWADDKYWLPVFLEGKRFRALFEFDDESTILRHELRALADDEVLEPFAG